MEYKYITGKITLREIFHLYWGVYIKWYDGEVRKVIIEIENQCDYLPLLPI